MIFCRIKTRRYPYPLSKTSPCPTPTLGQNLARRVYHPRKIMTIGHQVTCPTASASPLRFPSLLCSLCSSSSAPRQMGRAPTIFGIEWRAQETPRGEVETSLGMWGKVRGSRGTGLPLWRQRPSLVLGVGRVR